MSLAIALQMDEISKVDIKTDTTFALGFEAQKRGHYLFYYHPRELIYDHGTVKASVHALTLNNTLGDHYQIEEPQVLDLKAMDVILLRQDPPFNLGYITSTYLLESIADDTLIVNNPTEVRNCPEKMFICHFPELMPPTLITEEKAAIEKFREKHKDIVLKPLYGCGGTDVFRVKEDDTNMNAIVDILTRTYQHPFVIQRYIPDVVKGDKRILLLNGEPLGAINRIPATGEARANLHVGGTAAATELTERDLEICERLKPELQKRGLLFVGIDVIGDYLTEINVTSPTGIQEINRLNDLCLEEQVWDRIEQLV